MSFFGSNKRRKVSSKEYSPVDAGEEERLGNSEDVNATAQEIAMLTTALRKTHLYIKILAGLLAALLVLWAASNFGHIAKSEDNKDSEIIDSPLPPIGTQEVTFKENPIYAARPGPESNKAWNKLLPPGRGFVYVPNWESYSLPPGEETPYGMIYSVALFHQMHCLGQMRRFIWMFLDAILQNDTAAADRIKHMFTELDHTDHLTHCFDYLRQSIACAGDMALEWPRTEPDGRRFAVDGWDIPHQCRDWRQIMEYMDKNHFNMSAVDEIAPIGGSSGG